MKTQTTGRSVPPLLQLTAIEGTVRVRVTRTIVMEGPASWCAVGLQHATLPFEGKRIPYMPSSAGASIQCTSATVEILDEEPTQA